MYVARYRQAKIDAGEAPPKRGRPPLSESEKKKRAKLREKEKKLAKSSSTKKK